MARWAHDRVAAGLFALLLSASACFLLNRGSRSAISSAPDASIGEIALKVTNHNYLDVVIYVIHNGQRTRVGTVTGSSAAIFYLPGRLIGQGREIRLYGAPIGSTSYASTETLIVQAGQEIEWTLETDLRRSSVAVY
jgi:hypothetical protein